MRFLYQGQMKKILTDNRKSSISAKGYRKTYKILLRDRMTVKVLVKIDCAKKCPKFRLYRLLLMIIFPTIGNDFWRRFLKV